jgi:hypothetical protein
MGTHHGAEKRLAGHKAAVQAVEEPDKPLSYPAAALLRVLQNLVVGFALGQYLVRHTVEAARRPVASSKQHIGQGAGDTAIAVVEGVDGDKPKVGDGGLEHALQGSIALPLQGRHEPRIINYGT